MLVNEKSVPIPEEQNELMPCLVGRENAIFRLACCVKKKKGKSSRLEIWQK